MKKIIFSSMAIILLCLNSIASNRKEVRVMVDFNGANYNIEKQIPFDNGLSALEALMYVAKIQTHPIDSYVFVDEINNIVNIKGKNAWYFTVNGKPSKTLAINCNLEAGDVVKWIYKKDVCSKTIENKESCPDNFGM